jgi:hypothetical protein
MTSKIRIIEKHSARRPFICMGATAVVLILACSGSNRSKVETLSFTVDSTRLGGSFTDSVSGLSLRAPAGWRRLSAITLDRVRASIEADSTEAGLPVPWIQVLFSLKEQNAYLLVGRYDPSIFLDGHNSLVVWQKEELLGQFADSSVSYARFKHNRIVFEQLLASDAEFVVIKLFVQAPDRGVYQIEYVTRRSWYDTNLRAIESSIGSITFGS